MIGMVHVGALPGSPRHKDSIDQLISQAVREAGMLRDAGFDAIMIENMHDAPYVHGHHGPEIVAAMTRIVSEVRRATSLPLGVQVLSGGEREAVAISQSTGGSFIRCENFVYAHVADEGLLPQACAGALLRYRRMIDAQQVAICCDIKKKHASHAMTSDLDITDVAHAAEFFGADALIVTGGFTGQPVDEGELNAVRSAVSLPILVGSGVTAETAARLLESAHGLIVGSSIKVGGHWTGEVDPKRARELVNNARAG
jgi:hypothetical protein